MASPTSDAGHRLLVDTYAGWKGSLPEEEVRARVERVRQALAAPAEKFDPARALPGWFAGEAPAEFVPRSRRSPATCAPRASGSGS